MTADSHPEAPGGNRLATDADARDGAVATRILGCEAQCESANLR